MKRRYLILLALAVLALSGSAWASNGSVTQGYDLSPRTAPLAGQMWWTVDGGGGSVAEGVYSLSGTIGQPDAGPALAGAGYTLRGGFWYGAAEPAGHVVYLPLVVRDH